MPHFKNKVLQGQTYRMDHLDPFLLQLTYDNVAYAVKVTYSCHCFTEEFSSDHAPDRLYVHGGEKRSFCTTRYALSLGLPKIITDLPKSSVYAAERNNYFVLRTVQHPSPYVIFFAHSRATRSDNFQVNLIIQSAHPRDGFAMTANPVKFSKLIACVAEGKPVTTGPRAMIKRK